MTMIMYVDMGSIITTDKLTSWLQEVNCKYKSTTQVERWHFYLSDISQPQNVAVVGHREN